MLYNSLSSNQEMESLFFSAGKERSLSKEFSRCYHMFEWTTTHNPETLKVMVTDAELKKRSFWDTALAF